MSDEPKKGVGEKASSSLSGFGDLMPQLTAEGFRKVLEESEGSVDEPEEATSGNAGIPHVPKPAWSQIIGEASNKIGHRLLCALIREIALISLERIDQDPAEDELDESRFYLVEQTILEWQNESVPYGSDLSLILGQLDYFKDLDMAWDERFPLLGRIYFDPTIVWDLKVRLENYPEARDSVTEELVEDFYSDWQDSFLRRVMQEVQSLSDKADEVSMQPATLDPPMPNLTPEGVADIVTKADNTGERVGSHDVEYKRQPVDTSAKRGRELLKKVEGTEEAEPAPGKR